MTEEAVEAVARALCAADWSESRWGQSDEHGRKFYRARAKAAITAYLSQPAENAELLALREALQTIARGRSGTPWHKDDPSCRCLQCAASSRELREIAAVALSATPGEAR
jgi:hypothetical protein